MSVAETSDTTGGTRAGSLADAVARQVDSNRSAAGHERYFLEHRTRLTQEILTRAPAGGTGRLCLLGAGNANDIDLSALVQVYREVHLVDIDRDAVDGAVDRLAERERSRVMVHAPLDVSGLFDRLELWSRLPPEPAALAREVEAVPDRVTALVPGPFDVVVSCCLLTQLQLVLLEVVGDRNARFGELRTALGASHVRTLASLLAPGGVALLVTDLTGSATYPFEALGPEVKLLSLMADLLAAGNIIHAAHPGPLSAVIRRDAALRDRYAVKFPVGPWLWRNGPEQTYLVYGLEITARADPGAVSSSSTERQT